MFERSPRRPRCGFGWRPAGWLVLALAMASGCGGGAGEKADAPAPRLEIADAGPIHVHGLGINPADGALVIATHTGLFRAANDEHKARRVGDRFQDTMGFTVLGPNRFLGSGHPDGRDRLPPFLGLIRSENAGKSWQPVSLLGKRDFHVLEASRARVYGFGSDFKTREEGLLVSEDVGRTWSQRQAPEPLIALAIDPRDKDHIVGSGMGGLHVSSDSGRRWKALDGPAGLLAWGAALTIVDQEGTVWTSADPKSGRRKVGRIGGQPAALENADGDLYVALHDGTVKRSTDAGRKWTVRSRP